VLSKPAIEAQFKVELPTEINKRILDRASQVPVAFSRCDPATGAAADAGCSSRLNRTLLVGVLNTSLKNRPLAEEIVGKLKDESFVCKPVEEREYSQCWWHPYFERVNVLPRAIEAVWENDASPLSADHQLVEALAPASAACFGGESEPWTRLPTYVPVNWYGDELCSGCIPLP